MISNKYAHHGTPHWETLMELFVQNHANIYSRIRVLEGDLIKSSLSSFISFKYPIYFVLEFNVEV